MIKIAKYIVKHDRVNCIGCAACTAVDEKHWAMNDDGKADLKGGTHLSDGSQELEIDESEYMPNKEAADSCPVNTIHIIDKQTNKKII